VLKVQLKMPPFCGSNLTAFVQSCCLTRYQFRISQPHKPVLDRVCVRSGYFWCTRHPG